MVGLGGTGLRHVDQRAEVDLLDFSALRVGSDEVKSFFLVFLLVADQEVVGLDDDGHALDDFLAGHRHVCRHRAADDCLRNLVHRHVADEDHAASEDERLRQFVVTAERRFRVPGDDTLVVAVEGGFEQVGSNRVLQHAVAVIEDDEAVAVLEEGTVETLGGREALDNHVGLRRQTFVEAGADLSVIEVDLAGALQGSEDGMRLAETALAGDDGRRDGASRNHVDEVLQDLEALVDVEDELRVDRLGRSHRLRRADFLNSRHTQLLGPVADLVDDLVNDVVLASRLQEDLATVGRFPLGGLLVVAKKGDLGHLLAFVSLVVDRCIIHQAHILYTTICAKLKKTLHLLRDQFNKLFYSVDSIVADVVVGDGHDDLAVHPDIEGVIRFFGVGLGEKPRFMYAHVGSPFRIVKEIPAAHRAGRSCQLYQMARAEVLLLPMNHEAFPIRRPTTFERALNETAA